MQRLPFSAKKQESSPYRSGRLRGKNGTITGPACPALRERAVVGHGRTKKRSLWKKPELHPMTFWADTAVAGWSREGPRKKRVGVLSFWMCRTDEKRLTRRR